MAGSFYAKMSLLSGPGKKRHLSIVSPPGVPSGSAVCDQEGQAQPSASSIPASHVEQTRTIDENSALVHIGPPPANVLAPAITSVPIPWLGKSSSVEAPQSPELMATTWNSKCVEGRYQLFAPHILDAMDGVRAARGLQLRSLVSASLFTGLAPERKAYELAGINTSHRFGVDNKLSSLRFCAQNGSGRDAFEHLFTDVNTLVDNKGRAPCYLHGNVCSTNVCGTMLDSLVGGSTCKAFSSARTGRSKSTVDHADQLLMVFLCRH